MRAAAAPPPRRRRPLCIPSTEPHRAAAPIRDAICANGYERIPYGDLAGRLNSYDTFAMVESNGNWMYRSLLESPTNYQRTVELFDAISRGGSTGTDGLSAVYPMRDCFSGLSVYRIDGLWDGAGRGCTYTSRPAAIAEFTAPPSKMQPGDCDGKCWCEHVALLECVREARGAAPIGREEGGLRVGVLPSLVAERKWGVAFKHRQARWAAMQAAATQMTAPREEVL